MEKKNEKDKSALTIKICGFVLLGAGIAAAITAIVATVVLGFSYETLPILCGACALACVGAYLAFNPKAQNRKENKKDQAEDESNKKRWENKLIFFYITRQSRQATTAPTNDAKRAIGMA